MSVMLHSARSAAPSWERRLPMRRLLASTALILGPLLASHAWAQPLAPPPASASPSTSAAPRGSASARPARSAASAAGAPSAMPSPHEMPPDHPPPGAQGQQGHGHGQAGKPQIPGQFDAPQDIVEEAPALGEGAIGVEVRDADGRAMPGIGVTLGIL